MQEGNGSESPVITLYSELGTVQSCLLSISIILPRGETWLERSCVIAIQDFFQNGNSMLAAIDIEKPVYMTDGVRNMLNTLSPRQHGCYCPDDMFKCIFLNKKSWTWNTIWLQFVPKGPVDNNKALVQVMVWRRTGDKSFSELMTASIGNTYMRHSASVI